MNPAKTVGRVAVLTAAVLAATACAPKEQGPSQTGETAQQASACTPHQLQTLQPGTLTIGTDKPAYEPWFVGNDPTNGRGFESAVAYAVADQLGYARPDVTWTTVPFNSSYAPGPKDFDLDINQISITPEREKVVDFSDGYYAAAQAVIVKKDSPLARASSLADLKDAALGAQVGTTSLSAAEDAIAPTQAVNVFDDTNAAKQALDNGQIDGIVVDLPTAFYITAVEIPDGTIVGQFDVPGGQQEEFGLLFAQGSPLVPCVNRALAQLDTSGELAALEKRWLSDVVDVPKLT